MSIRLLCFLLIISMTQVGWADGWSKDYMCEP